jgi:hypothetical protein
MDNDEEIVAIDQLDIRDCILKFAVGMEEKLQKHDDDYGEKGWETSNYFFLCNRIGQELKELLEYLISKDNTKENRERMKKECCDIANFSMMIFDKLNKEDNS